MFDEITKSKNQIRENNFKLVNFSISLPHSG